MSEPPKILGYDEDRQRQASVAMAFHAAGFTYRFVAEPGKLLSGIQRFSPQALLVFGDVNTEFVNQALDTLAQDARAVLLPVILVCRDDAENEYCRGLKTGLVELWKKPFSPSVHPAALLECLRELEFRPGWVSGRGDSLALARLVEHLRRSKRSGQLLLNPRQAHEGSATWILGKLDTAVFAGATGVEALIKMVTLPSADWQFSEMSGDGSGIVLDAKPAEEELPALVVGQAEEDSVTVPYEMVPPPEVQEEIIPTAMAAVPRTLLFVDDDPILAKMFTSLFRAHGFEVLVAKDGLEGFQRCLQDDVDVVVADLNMPRMDGWGMLRMMREDHRTREMPLAFLSCHDDYRLSLQAADAGAQAYIPKGTKLDAIVQQVHRLLAPRDAFLQDLSQKAERVHALAEIGSLWALRELSRIRFTGQWQVDDAFAHYRAVFSRGEAIHAAAHSGEHRAVGERAFAALAAVRSGTGQPSFQEVEVERSLNGDTAHNLQRAISVLNGNAQRVRELELIHAQDLEVVAPLYQVYKRVGPKTWLDTAHKLCELRMDPREILASGKTSALELEEVMKDLLRRGVLHLPLKTS